MSFFNSIEALGEGAISPHKGILLSSTHTSMFTVFYLVACPSNLQVKTPSVSYEQNHMTFSLDITMDILQWKIPQWQWTS